MRRSARIGLAALLVLAGLGTTTFFWLLFAITDCSVECVTRGERAVPLAFVGLGLGLATAGVVTLRHTRRALASGLVVAGISGALGIAWIMATEGARGQAIWLLIVTIGLAAIGAWMWRAEDGGRVRPTS